MEGLYQIIIGSLGLEIILILIPLMFGITHYSSGLLPTAVVGPALGATVVFVWIEVRVRDEELIHM